MSASIRNLCAAICVTVFVTGPAQSDETTAAVSKAKTLYRQGSFGKAFNQLETARTLIARRLSARYAETLPPAPNGWRAKAALYSTKGTHRVGRGLVLYRHYYQNGGKGVATVQVNIDQQALIETVQEQKRQSQPERHAAGAKRRLVRVKGVGNAFVKFSDWRGIGNLNTMVAGRFYITVSARNVKSQAFLTTLLSSWDFAALKRTAGVKPVAFADNPTAAIRKVGTDYRSGKLGSAFTHAEIAATLIARRLSRSYVKTFPAAPSGWRARPIQSSIKGKARAGRTLRLHRDYVQDGGRGVATAQLITDRPRIIAIAKAIKGGPAKAKREKRIAERIGGTGTAFVKFDGARKAGDLYIFVGDHFYITVRARNVDDRAVLMKLLSGWDFVGLKTAAGLN